MSSSMRRRHPLTTVEHFDRRRADAYVHQFPHERDGDRVEVVEELDMVIQVDAGQPPLGVLVAPLR